MSVPASYEQTFARLESEVNRVVSCQTNQRNTMSLIERNPARTNRETVHIA